MIGILSAAYRLPPVRAHVAEWCRDQAWDAPRTQALLASGAEHFHAWPGEGLMERCTSLGATPAQLASLRANGGDQYHYVQAEPLLALAGQTVQEALDRAAVLPQAVDAVIWFHTSQCTVLAPPVSTVGRVRAALGLSNALAFSISQQNCVSTLHGLRVLQALFTAHPKWRYAVVLGLDTILREDLRAIGTSGIQSDASSALVISRAPHAQTIVALETYNDSRQVQGIHASGEYEQNDHYLWSAVSLIRRTLKAAGIPKEALTSILPHNTNLPGWHHTLDSLRIPHEVLFTGNFARIGHAFGSDVAINLADSGALRAPGYHLVFSSGIGGCFGSFILHTKDASQ